MIRHILIPTDGSECATAALEQAVSFAVELKARVTFLVVTEPFRLLSVEVAQLERIRSEFTQYEGERAKHILDRARAVAEKEFVPCTVSMMEHPEPYEAIIETGQRCGAGMIAMGSHGLGGVRAIVLGSVTQKVLTHCRIPVVVYR
ncbi:universal stress protein [Achromobacter sp. HZ28]|nr:universal stress protein [Achromobacter sp. HZ34]OWT79777.1 universal stress protein [Achromobacter sp. HZ28]